MNLARLPVIGIAFLIASNGLTASVDGVAKLLTADLHSLQIVWGYCAVIFALLLVFALGRRTPLRRTLATRRRGTHFLRAGMLVATISALFWGLAYIPLADATAIAFMAPLFVTTLSGPMLGERIGAHRWVAVAAGFVGVVLIVRPQGGGLQWAVLLPLVSALFFALFQIMTRRLAATESTFTTLFYTGLGGMVWSSLLVPFVWRPMTATHLLVFAGIGALGVGAHLCMIRAFTAAEASLLAPFNYVKLVWAVAIGYLLFADVPGPAVLTGAAVIVASGLYVLVREGRDR